MIKWEYSYILHNSGYDFSYHSYIYKPGEEKTIENASLSHLINGAGAQGWELVNMSPVAGMSGRADQIYCCFRRPIE